MKKSLVIVLTLAALFIAAAPLSAQRLEDFGWAIESSGDLRGTVTMVRYSGTARDIIIPAYIDGRPVTKQVAIIAI